MILRQRESRSLPALNKNPDHSNVVGVLFLARRCPRRPRTLVSIRLQNVRTLRIERLDPASVQFFDCSDEQPVRILHARR